MNFSFSTTYKLDKAYFIECYEQTAKPKKGLAAYSKACFLLFLGMLVSTLGQQGHIALFIVVLAIVEALSVFFAKTWWVWRQQLSRVANSEVKLTVDQSGISSQSDYQKIDILWPTVSQVITTEKGLIIVHNQYRTYLSGQILSDEAYQFILQQGKNNK